MIISNELIYLQLQKTGCTHIEKLLSQNLETVKRGKHNRLIGDPGARLLVGSIRNPWDWYVSLWSYGCLHRGSIYTELVRPNGPSVAAHIRQRLTNVSNWRGLGSTLWADLTKDVAHWRALYGDASDKMAFREWLTRILSSKPRPHVEDGFPFLPIADHNGLLTYRFLRLFTEAKAWDRSKRSLTNYQCVRRYYETTQLNVEFIRMECLEEGVARILEKVGKQVDRAVLCQGKTNASVRASYTDYYDQAAIDLVYEKDRLIADLFGYSYGE